MLKSGSTTAFSCNIWDNITNLTAERSLSFMNWWFSFLASKCNIWKASFLHEQNNFRFSSGKFGAKHRNQQTITCQVLAELNKIWSYLLRYLSNIFQCKWVFFLKKICKQKKCCHNSKYTTAWSIWESSIFYSIQPKLNMWLLVDLCVFPWIYLSWT